MTSLALILLWLFLAHQTTSPKNPPGTSVSGEPSHSDTPVLLLPANGKPPKGLMRILQPPGTNPAGATLTDNGTAPKITFTSQGSAAADSGVYLYFLADAEDVPLSGLKAGRRATLQLASGSPQSITYTVTNRATQPDKLMVLLTATDWSMLSRPLPIVVSTTDAPATGLRVSGVFTEKSSHDALPLEALELCRNPEGECDSRITIPAYVTATVYLRHGGAAPTGTYSGAFALAALEYAPTSGTKLNVYISSASDVFWGVVSVALGVLLAWWVKTWSSNRIARDQALLPVASAQARLRALGYTLHSAAARLDTECPVLNVELQDWMRKLDPQALVTRYGLPDRSVGPFKSVAAISGDFTAFLNQVDAAINLLSAFVIDGVKLTADLTAAGRIPAPAGPKTTGAIDQYFREDLKLDDARKHIADLISQAQSRTAFAAEALTMPPANTVPQLSFSSLLVEIRLLNGVAWAILLAVSALGTILALVLKPGFGRFSDDLLCFTTAFGLPTIAGAALPSQSMAAKVTQTTQPTSGSNSGVSVGGG